MILVFFFCSDFIFCPQLGQFRGLCLLWQLPPNNLAVFFFDCSSCQSLASCLSFQHFLEELEETQLSSDGGQIEDLPLLVSLAALLEGKSAGRGPTYVVVYDHFASI